VQNVAVQSGYFLHAGSLVKASLFFDLPASLAAFKAHFSPEVAPWEWLKVIGQALNSVELPPAMEGFLPGHPGVHVSGRVYLHPSVKLPAFATLIGPAWIGPNVDIRPGAYVRGNVIVGQGSVLGNSCEYKNCLLMDQVETMHFNYVGDSILGNGAHLGAGVICSNLRLDRQPITVQLPDGLVETGLRKFGAILGDKVEVGSNVVLNPGAVLGKRALVAPAIAFTGYLPAATIARARTQISFVERRD
jgi:NDP-sugar pyrophosphorylase family protein